MIDQFPTSWAMLTWRFPPGTIMERPWPRRSRQMTWWSFGENRDAVAPHF